MGRSPWCSMTIIKGRKQPQDELAVMGCREATSSWTPRSRTLSAPCMGVAPRPRRLGPHFQAISFTHCCAFAY